MIDLYPLSFWPMLAQLGVIISILEHSQWPSLSMLHGIKELEDILSMRQLCPSLSFDVIRSTLIVDLLFEGPHAMDEIDVSYPEDDRQKKVSGDRSGGRKLPVGVA